MMLAQVSWMAPRSDDGKHRETSMGTLLISPQLEVEPMQSAQRLRIFVGALESCAAAALVELTPQPLVAVSG